MWIYMKPTLNNSKKIKTKNLTLAVTLVECC